MWALVYGLGPWDLHQSTVDWAYGTVASATQVRHTSAHIAWAAEVAATWHGMAWQRGGGHVSYDGRGPTVAGTMCHGDWLRGTQNEDGMTGRAVLTFVVAKRARMAGDEGRGGCAKMAHGGEVALVTFR